MGDITQLNLYRSTYKHAEELAEGGLYELDPSELPHSLQDERQGCFVEASYL
jgi:hypothetical protein